MRPTLLLAACAMLAGPALGQRPATAPPAPPEAERLSPGSRQGFVVDAATGCWVWLSGMPKEAEEPRVTWSGPCPDGPAEGEGRATFAWREGTTAHEMIYDGEVVRGRSVGRGRQVHLIEGEPVMIQSGDYVDDLLARGRFELPREGIVYEGGLATGRPHGPGRLTLRRRSFEGNWQQGCLNLAGDTWLAVGRNPESCRGQDS